MAIDPNIKKKADDIRNKIYGKEVRESLASGLEEMSSDVVENEGRQSVVESRQDSVESQFQDVIENTTDKDVISAPEIIAARDGEANLKARLDKEKNEVTAQLAQTEQELEEKKIDKGNVSVNDINKNLGKFDGTYFSDLFLEDLNNGALDVTNVLDGSLTQDKFSFPVIEGATSRNLFNKESIIRGKFYDYRFGTLSDSPNYFATLIKIEPGVLYGRPPGHGQQSAFFDKDMNYLSGLVSTESFTSPPNAVFIGMSGLLNNLESEQLELGGYTGYEDFGTKLKDDFVDIHSLSKDLQGDMKTQMCFGINPTYKNNINDWAIPESLDATVNSNYSEFLEGNHFLEVVNESGSRVDGVFYDTELPEPYKRDSSKTVRVVVSYKSNKSFRLRLYQRKENGTWTQENTPANVLLPPSTKERRVEVYTQIKEDASFIMTGFWSMEDNTTLKVGSIKHSIIGVSNLLPSQEEDQEDQEEPEEQEVTRQIEVEQDGTGDFETIQEAIDSSDSSKETWVEILIGSGTYTEEITGRNGIILKGIDRDKVIIKSLPESSGLVNRDGLKTHYEMIIKNLTVNTEFGKYCIHADSSVSGEYTCLLENVRLDKKQAAQYGNALGVGLRAGQHLKLKNCIVKGADKGMYLHNWTNQKGNSTLEIDNSVIEGENGVDLHVQSLGSGATDLIILKNNVIEEIEVGRQTAYGYDQDDYEFIASGNQVGTFKQSDGSQTVFSQPVVSETTLVSE